MKKKELFFTILLLILDQGTKYAMECFLHNGSVNVIPNFFQLDFVHNTGGAWSILNDYPIFLIIIGVVCLFALAFMKPTVRDSNLKSFSFAFLYAGIMGNLLDRIVFGYVKDFFSFNLFGYHFPVFNVADILIVIGAFLLILTIWKGESYGKDNRRTRRKNEN